MKFPSNDTSYLTNFYAIEAVREIRHMTAFKCSFGPLDSTVKARALLLSQGEVKELYLILSGVSDPADKTF